jgi:molybdopterin molybdotransferase
VRYGFSPKTVVVSDDRGLIQHALEEALEAYDVVLTSGGAWKSGRDLVAPILEQMKWEKIYHRVKMGPGKAVGFGICHEKPVFLLPGGPPSNHMAFLQLALPAIKVMAGWQATRFPLVKAKLEKTLRGQIDWTQFVHGKLTDGGEGNLLFTPSRQKSRLQMMAASDAVAKIAEGVDCILAGEFIHVQKLS